jgi:hypothetical protein
VGRAAPPALQEVDGRDVSAVCEVAAKADQAIKMRPEGFVLARGIEGVNACDRRWATVAGAGEKIATIAVQAIGIDEGEGIDDKQHASSRLAEPLGEVADELCRFRDVNGWFTSENYDERTASHALFAQTRFDEVA